MQTYETLFITPPDLAEEDEKTTVDLLAKIVTDGGGTFHANERLGRRRLGYPIRKFEDGVYVRFLYDSECEVPHELERRTRLTDKVLRSLTVRLEEDWAAASKTQAVVDSERRVAEAEARVKAEEEAAAAAEVAAAEAAVAAAEAARVAAETPAAAEDAPAAADAAPAVEATPVAEATPAAEDAAETAAPEATEEAAPAGDSETKE